MFEDEGDEREDEGEEGDEGVITVVAIEVFLEESLEGEEEEIINGMDPFPPFEYSIVMSGIDLLWSFGGGLGPGIGIRGGALL